jgi:ribonuclease BN (tRNA processing enzyme)
MDGHLTPHLAGRIGKESHCKKLLLIHLYPICDQFDIVGQCREVFHGEIILAEDFMRIPL